VDGEERFMIHILPPLIFNIKVMLNTTSGALVKHTEKEK
jgi:hypothetical protein